MAYKSLTDGIIFVEGSLKCQRQLGRIEYTKESWFNSQLNNLGAIRKQLALKAKNLGANVVTNFQYGQKSKGFWGSMLLGSDDNIDWYANGTAAVIDDLTYNEIVQKIQNS